jgi:hypothetical protein
VPGRSRSRRSRRLHRARLRAVSRSSPRANRGAVLDEEQLRGRAGRAQPGITSRPRARPPADT